MSQPGYALLFKFGDGLDPEAFTLSCSINTSRKLDLTTESSATAVNPCDDDAPTTLATMVRRPKSLDVKFSGEGVADMASFKALVTRWKTGQVFNGKVIEDVAVDGWTITGPWLIESMSIGASDQKDEQTFSISLAIAGAFTFV